MKTRTVIVLFFVLASVALGVWWWVEKRNVAAPPPANVTASPEVGEPGTSTTISAPPASPSRTAPSDPVSALAAPVRVASAVEAGMPLVRSAPPGPLPAAAVVAQRGSAPRPQAEGQAELEEVQLMLRDFRTRLGENPTGSNAEIMRSVMGGNSVRANLGPPSGQNLNEQGELVDRWGTPYFFHQLSKEKMEIRSAGPDRTMYTSDDLSMQ